MTVINTPNQTMNIHDLNPEKGIINIGSHPENDVVVQDPRVMPFHMMVDLRQKPYLVIGLDPNAEISIDGMKIAENESVEVMDINQVSFCGYTLTSTSKNGSDALNQIAVIAPENSHDYHTNPSISETQYIPLPTARLPIKESVSSTELQSFVPTSDVILVEPHEQKLTINVEQTAIFPFTIINGGSIVASFELKVEGVPSEWVKVVPERVNLNEGGRGRIEVHITPPRNPDSQAGDYSVLVKVGSYNYPGQFTGVRVDLTINPYYEFAVGNLSPRTKSVSWGKNTAIAQFPITNQGNSTTNYLVMAQDDENGCKFEFQVQDDVSLVKQAEIALKPGEVRDLPVRISPNKRHLVRLRSKQHQYSVTTQSLNENAASRIVSGTVVSRPLFGLFSILIALAILLISAFFILRPRIIDFNVVEDVIALGEPAILNWKVTPFTSNLRIEGVSEEISGSQNQVEVIPTNTAETYTLVAGNWLSRLLRMDDVRSKPITVLAIPPSPQISTFFVDKTRIFEGDDITIKWSVTDVEETFLTVDGVRSALSPDEFNSERTVTLRNDSLVVLEAKNDSGSQFQSEFIHAQKPTIVIEEFTLSDTTIIRGESVTIKWKVSGIGAENVMIAPFEEVYPLEGELTFFPEASMEFVLTVKNRDLEQIKLLPVGVMEPGAEPQPPTVEFFKVAPEEIVGSGAVEFSWSVSGISDRIEISSIDGVVLAGLPAQGFMSFNVSKTTSYVLTAFNGDLSSAAILEVKVNETKNNAIIEIDKILPSTAINRGDSVMVYYSVYPATKENVKVDSEAMGWPEISGSVVVTDGFDTCEPVDLPVHACSLTLNTSENNKQIYATYSGDDNYVRRTSDPYPLGLDVVGASAKFTSFAYSVSPIVVGQQTTVSFQIAPEDPAATIPISGKVKVLNNDATLCIASLSAAIDNPMAAKGECLLTFTQTATEYLTLVYEGNDIYDGKTISMPVLEVKQANTQTILTSKWSTITVVGEPILVDFAVGALAPGTGTPTGQVTVMNKNNPLEKCTATLNSTGKGQCSLLLTQTGTIEIIGEYAGDDNFITSNSISYYHPVSKASTTTTISSFTPTTTSVGQQVLVKYQVKVGAPGSGVPTGNVTINAGNGNTCTGTINATGLGECAVLLTKTGVQSVSATYAGDASFIGSIGSGYSYTVSIAATRTIVSTPEPSPSAISDLVKVSFTVSLSQTSLIKPNGTVRVEASTGENCLATVTEGTGFCNLAFATEGTRTIKVLFLGTSDYAASESTSITHIVVRESKTSITSTTLNPVVDQSAKIDFSVVAVTGGGGTPTGDVTVNSDTGETCSGALTNGSGSCYITFTKSGTKNLTAIYQGNTEYKTSTSAIYSISVAKASTTTEITSDLSATKQVGESINVAVKVTANISATPTGSVTISIVGSTVS
ncbi:MAG: Ig-like domain-containing protein, partial [Anaerolineaceae bacterium]|nr:Ig-like domain-containing protein [Anaerolineaceae bacterium]